MELLEAAEKLMFSN